MTDRAANLDAARAYLQEARRRRHAPASRAFCWTLLQWAVNARRRATEPRASEHTTGPRRPAAAPAAALGVAVTDLPPLDFDLTPEDRAKAEQARAHLQRLRRERNRRDDARERGPEDDAP